MTDQDQTPDSKPAAPTQTPQTPNGWTDPWTRPSAWAAFGSDTDKDQP